MAFNITLDKLISIHALRGEGDVWNLIQYRHLQIFLSTPSVGRATRYFNLNCISPIFLSTPSVGRATFRVTGSCYNSRISIHALRGEGDMTVPKFLCNRIHVYPRPPWGGRLCC